MAVRRPLAPNSSGVSTPIRAPDTIPADILPATSSDTPVTIAAGVTFNVPANTQKLFHVGLAVDGVLQVDGYLIGV